MIAAFLTSLALAAPVHAPDRLEPLRKFGDVPRSAGSALVWTTPGELVSVGDARGHVRLRLELGEFDFCRVADARAWGAALVGCTAADGTPRAYLIKVRSGRVRELAIEGFPEALGRRWIESVAQPPDCDRCGTIVYTNRLTRAQRRFDVNEPPDFDLDGATLRRPPGNSRQLAYHGRRWIEGRGRGSTERLWLRGDGSPRLVGACRPSCSVVDLTARQCRTRTKASALGHAARRESAHGRAPGVAVPSTRVSGRGAAARVRRAVPGLRELGRDDSSLASAARTLALLTGTR